jgi:hypothetical protein
LRKQCNSPIEKAAGQTHNPGFAKTVALINWDFELIWTWERKKKPQNFSSSQFWTDLQFNTAFFPVMHGVVRAWAMETSIHKNIKT